MDCNGFRGSYNAPLFPSGPTSQVLLSYCSSPQEFKTSLTHVVNP